jgi:siroheme synthase
LIAERLITGGMQPDTPVAVITSATCADQEITRLRLDALGIEPVRNPSIIVVGAVAALDVTGAEVAALVGAAAASESTATQPSSEHPFQHQGVEP